jgi:4-carboxymuconolactone decarboxylase
LEPLRGDDLVGEQAELYASRVGTSVRPGEGGLNERGEVRGVYSVMLHHPSSAWPLQDLAGVLRFRGLLPDAAREVVILVVAAHSRDAHEWFAHEPIARDAGMTDNELAALHDGADVTFADPVTQAACDAARAIVTRGDISDEEYARMGAVLGQEQLVELTVLIGFYSLLAMQLRVFRIPTPFTY